MTHGRALVAFAAAFLLSAAFTMVPKDAGSSNATMVERGRYIVEGVAVCWRCHSPRDATGAFDESRWLAGSPVPFEPSRPTDDWADVAPRLAGLPPGTDSEFITLMMTGISRTGKPPRSPMPQFRMSRPDAEAVLAYLKSVQPAP